MKAMSEEKVGKFLSILNSAIDGLRAERSKLIDMNRSDLAYHCKMRVKQTELIRDVFLQLVNDEPDELMEQIARIFNGQVID